MKSNLGVIFRIIIQRKFIKAKKMTDNNAMRDD